MTASLIVSLTSPDGERRLSEFGLSTEIIHTALRPGLDRATNRSELALRSTPGTDIYHDTMEQFAKMLADSGWRLVYVDLQPRLLHPDRVLAFTLASGINVANPDPRQQPKTLRKGRATRTSLAGPRAELLPLFSEPGVEQEMELVDSAREAPLWMLVHERTPRGLKLEFSRPQRMTDGGVVTDWDDRIILEFLDLDGDLSVFGVSGDGDYDGGYDVVVEPL